MTAGVAARGFLVLSIGALVASFAHWLFHYTSFTEQVIRVVF